MRLALGVLALLTTLGSLGLLLLARRATDNAVKVYRDRLLPMQQLMEVADAYTVDITFALRAVRGGQMAPDQGIDILAKNEARASRAWNRFKDSRPVTPDIQAAEASLLRLRRMSGELADLLPAGVTPQLGIFGDTAWLPEVVALSHHMERLREAEDRQAQALIQELESQSRRTTLWGLLLMASVLALTLGYGGVFSAHLRRDTHRLLAHLRRVADGNFEPVPVASGEGELVWAEQELNRTVQRLRQLMTDLQHQQAWERSLLNCAPAAIIGLDLEGRVSHFSAGAEHMLGYPAEVMVGTATPLSWRLPEELTSLAKELSQRVGRPVAPGIEVLQVAATLPGFSTECHYKAKDGTLIPVLLNLSQIRDSEGRLIGSMGVALDRRDVIRLREELRASEARYRQLAERLPDVVYQTQIWPDGRRSWPFVSPQFQRFYGIEGSVLEGDPSYSLKKVHPEDLPGYQRCLEEATRRLEPLEWEGRSFTERPGELRWIRVRRSPTLQADGSVLWDGVLEDITKLKLSEEALRLSEARAQEATRAKSAFLSNMSHELRTPLNAILGYAQLMNRRRAGSPEDQDQLARILAAGEHLLTLINDVLSLGKIESGGLEFKAASLRVRPLLEGVVDMQRLRAQAKGLDVRLEVDPSLPANLEGDAAKLRQVLVNLLGNAVKFTSKGAVTLQVRYASGLASFVVMDTGPGISEADQNQLFRPFYQAGNHPVSAEGTGLGLYISRSLVRLMGGELTLQSRLGEGSSFRFSLPMPEGEALLEVQGRGRVLGLAPGQREVTMLVVDDRMENRDLLVQMLASVGFKALSASDGLEAVEIWKRSRPDLVWMDLHMPRMNGFEALQVIRGQELEEGRTPTFVVAISASVIDLDRETLRRTGFDDFLGKPFLEAQLFELVSRLLGLEFITQAPENPTPLLAPRELSRELQTQPEAWREALREAVLTGDTETALSLLERLEGVALTQGLRHLIRSYKLQELLDLMSHHPKE